jgi:hypothetical protein
MIDDFNSSFPFLSFFFFWVILGVGVLTQGLQGARQVLYHSSHVYPQPFYLYIFYELGLTFMPEPAWTIILFMHVNG